jgi:NADH:ubiquinone oxidoreductase subunit 6 (subunit J)
MVYIGAIAVPSLFVVMMLNINRIERDNTSYSPIGCFLSIMFVMQLSYMISSDSAVHNQINVFINDTLLYPTFDDEFASASSVQQVGFELFINYPIALISSGITLLVSPIGSIYLTNTNMGYSLRILDTPLSRNSNIYNVHIYQRHAEFVSNAPIVLSSSLFSLGAHIGHVCVEAYDYMSYFVMGTRSKNAILYLERLISHFGHAPFCYSSIDTLNANVKHFFAKIIGERNQSLSY